jgi:hypothetical protein
MRDFEHLTCPACGEPSDRPLATFVARPRWRCRCGYTVDLPSAQVRAMLARIERARKLVRFAERPE